MCFGRAKLLLSQALRVDVDPTCSRELLVDAISFFTSGSDGASPSREDATLVFWWVHLAGYNAAL